MRYIKTFESIARAKSFIGNKMQQYEKLKEILSKNPGYVGQMTEWLFDDKIPLNELESLYNKLINLKRNGKPIHIDDKQFEKVVDEILKAEQEIDVYRIVNKMSSNSKALVKKIIQEPNYNLASTFSLFYKLSKKGPEIIQKFLSRSASFKTLDDIEKYYKILDIGIVNTKEYIKSSIENLENSHIVYDKDNILVLQVGDHEDIKKIANDCTWCIVQYKSNWDSYCNGRYQFIVWNFNLMEFENLFKIGITMRPDSTVYVAFDYMNKSCLEYAKEFVKKINLRPSSGKLEEIKRLEEIKKLQYLKNKVDEVKYTTNGKELKELYWGQWGWGLCIRNLEDKETKKNLCFEMSRNYFKSLNINEEGLTRVKNISGTKFETMTSVLNDLFTDKDIVYKEDLDGITPNLYKYILRNYESFGSFRHKIYEEVYKSSKNIDIINKIVNIINDDEFVSMSRNLFYWITELSKNMKENGILSFKEFFKSILNTESPIDGMSESYFNDLKPYFSIFEKMYKRIKKTKTIQKLLKEEFNLLKCLFGDKIIEKEISDEKRRLFWFIYNLPFTIYQPLRLGSYLPHYSIVPLDLIDFEKDKKLVILTDNLDKYMLSNIIRFSQRFHVVINIKTYEIKGIDFKSKYESKPESNEISEIYKKLLKFNGKFIERDSFELIPNRLDLKVI